MSSTSADLKHPVLNSIFFGGGRRFPLWIFHMTSATALKKWGHIFLTFEGFKMVAKGEKQWRRQVSKCCLVEEEAEIAIIPTMYTLRFAEDVFFGIFPMQKIPNNWGICRFFVFLIGGSCEAFQLHVGLPQIAPGLHVSHQHSRVLC